MDKEAVERVARAINLADHGTQNYQDCARAAINECMAILGEPTTLMLDWGEAELVGTDAPTLISQRIFQRMLSASPLSQGGQADG